MITLEKLIEDGYIFIGNKEEKGIGKRLTLNYDDKEIIVRIMPASSEKRITIPTEEDLKLYQLLKDEKAQLDKFFDLNELKEKLKDSVSDDFNVIESLERMHITIIIHEGISEMSRWLITSFSHREYLDTGKEEIAVSFT